MTTHTLRRWGAILFAGGLCLTLSYLFYPSTAHSSLIRPCALLGLVGVLMVLPGLIAYQRGQAARATVNGWIATTLLCTGLGMLEIAHLILGAFSPSSLYDLDAYHASLWGELEFPGVICIAIGTIVLAVATRRSGFYPGLAFWALVANVTFALADSFVVPLGDAVRTPAPNYALTALLGLAMIQVAKTRAETRTGAAESLNRPDSEISVSQ
jgi:hypothetical protein